MASKPANLTVTKDQSEQIKRSLEAMTRQQVLIGIPAGDDERYDTLRQAQKARKTGDKSKASAGAINNAALGYIHEHGSPVKNIPARPFLLPGVKSIQGKAANLLRGAAKLALAGNRGAVEKTLHAVGLLGQNAVRKKITDGPFAPLADSTLAARRRRGRTGTRPLIDTGQLRAAISYVIRKGKGGGNA